MTNVKGAGFGFFRAKQRSMASVKLFSVVFFLLISVAGYSTVYYVSSSSGNDTNPGTSVSSAWRSLDKVNSFTPKPGDQILFKRGDSWAGTITVRASGTSGSPVVYGAYGSGDKPKIYGSENITGWTRHSGNIWKATVKAGDVKQLFLNDDRMQLARYPDKGYFTVTSKISNTVFKSTDLNDNLDYAGATCFIKSKPWTLASVEVSKSTSQTITLTSAPDYGVSVKYGFWLVNKLEFLTQAGEWYFNSGTNTLYFWTANGDSPDNYMVRASIFSQGIFISRKSYVTLQNIELAQSGTDGINVINSNNIQIKNCSVTNPDGIGIYEEFNNNFVIDNNFIDGANSGVRTMYSEGTTITNNLIRNTGQINNFNKTVIDQDGTAIFVRGNNHVIHYNRLINSGFIGINSTGLDVSIKYNYLDGACQVLDDAAAIYVFSSSSGSYPNNNYTVGTVIEGNIVMNVHGVMEGKPSDNTYPHGNGIYLDGSPKRVTVKNNTVNFVSQGIYIQGGGQHVIEGNTFMDGMLGYRFNAGNEDILFSGNIVYQTARLGHQYGTLSTTAYQKLVYSNTGTFGKYKFDNNIYVARYNKEKIFRYTKSDGRAAFANDFSDWKRQTGQDANSRFISTSLASGETEKLFYNPTKDTKTYNINNAKAQDIYGNSISTGFTLKPFTSKIVIGSNLSAIIEVNSNSDLIPPVITSFDVIPTTSSLTVPVTSFFATDNIAVTGYKLTESSNAPDPDESGWSAVPLTWYTFSGSGSKVLYAWAKDAAGNVSAAKSVQVSITPEFDSGVSGNTEVYGLISKDNNRRAQQVSFNESGNIESLSIYHEGGTGNILLGVYSDNTGSPQSLLGLTPITPVSSTAGWQTVQLTTPVFVNSGETVWLSWVAEKNPGIRYTTGTPARAQSSQMWSSGMPSTFGSSSFTGYTYSVYCTYRSDNNSLKGAEITETAGKTDAIEEEEEKLLFDLDENDLIVYPNPAQSFVQVEFPDLGGLKTEIKIIDISGRVLVDKLVQTQTTRIDINHVSPGLYFIKMINSEINITKKFIISR